MPLTRSENAIFAPFLYPKRSFYQDRLGTNIGKALKTRGAFFLQAVDQLFECYDEDGSGTLSSVEWESFLRVASGEAEDAAAPPAGASANLDTVTEGTQVLAFYAADELWYGATVEGVFPGKELQLPDGSIATTLYYTVRYNAYPETTEVLNDSSLRLPPPKADDDTQSAEELEEEMRKLFETVDVSHDGADN